MLIPENTFGNVVCEWRQFCLGLHVFSKTTRMTTTEVTQLGDKWQATICCNSCETYGTSIH